MQNFGCHKPQRSSPSLKRKQPAKPNGIVVDVSVSQENTKRNVQNHTGSAKAS